MSVSVHVPVPICECDTWVWPRAGEGANAGEGAKDAPKQEAGVTSGRRGFGWRAIILMFLLFELYKRGSFRRRRGLSCNVFKSSGLWAGIPGVGAPPRAARATCRPGGPPVLLRPQKCPRKPALPPARANPGCGVSPHPAREAATLVPTLGRSWGRDLPTAARGPLIRALQAQPEWRPQRARGPGWRAAGNRRSSVSAAGKRKGGEILF